MTRVKGTKGAMLMLDTTWLERVDPTGGGSDNKHIQQILELNAVVSGLIAASLWLAERD